MMDGTDRHCRYFHRLMTRHTRLYTEMVTTDAVINGDRDHLLGFDEAEHPVALQLGGSDPVMLAKAARIGVDQGYDEINLNVGCPSDRVQSGAFGACLMRTPALVADCIAAMRAAVPILVTVKCRIGVDDQDPEESLYEFVESVSTAGCGTFIIHARKAWLKGLSPKENRDIPSLNYDLVRRLKRDRSDLDIILNGGIASTAAAKNHLSDFDGVMLGRTPYAEPYMLADVDREIFNVPGAMAPTRDEIISLMTDYIAMMVDKNSRFKPHHAARHMLGLFHGLPGARAWRRALSEKGATAGVDVLNAGLAALKNASVAAA